MSTVGWDLPVSWSKNWCAIVYWLIAALFVLVDVSDWWLYFNCLWGFHWIGFIFQRWWVAGLGSDTCRVCRDRVSGWGLRCVLGRVVFRVRIVVWVIRFTLIWSWQYLNCIGDRFKSTIWVLIFVSSDHILSFLSTVSHFYFRIALHSSIFMLVLHSYSTNLSSFWPGSDHTLSIIDHASTHYSDFYIYSTRSVFIHFITTYASPSSSNCESYYSAISS